MPPFRATLSDTEMAQLSNYVIFQFGGKDGKATAETVAARRKSEGDGAPSRGPSAARLCVARIAVCSLRRIIKLAVRRYPETL